MATLEDKILGDKLHNYCSSSEDESENENSDCESGKHSEKTETAPPTLPKVEAWEGTSTNTGPKGVIKDWQRYKQLEDDIRDADERQKLKLVSESTLTVQSVIDEEREKALALDLEMADLLNDKFLLDYQKQRMQEMLEQVNHKIKFGKPLFIQNKFI